MAAKTGIAWTDSTFNSWWGCTEVGITGHSACDHCYAKRVAMRSGKSIWGSGVERMQLSEHARNEPYRWQHLAAQFWKEYGRRRRVFTESMGDVFDNEVPDEWRAEHMNTIECCNAIDWQILTKRIGNVKKMVPLSWIEQWPKHVGLMITIVTQKEAERDLPRLVQLKEGCGIPWIGISYEPALEEIIFTPEWLRALDWIILGGESGAGWRTMVDWEYARALAALCRHYDTAFFMKQAAAFRPTDAMIPADLLVREFPT